MQAINADLSARLNAIHKNTLSADEYAALGAAIETRVAEIVSQCKLAPDADAMLHLVIADLAEGADVMRGKDHGKPSDGARKVVAALNGYGRHFQHPGWKPVK
jgi:hypothetical protein